MKMIWHYHISAVIDLFGFNYIKASVNVIVKISNLKKRNPSIAGKGKEIESVKFFMKFSNAHE